MKIFLKIFLLFFLFAAKPVFSQDNSSGTKTEKKADVESSRIRRKKDKMKWKERRKEERKSRHAVKAQEKRLQTKATRKRMKKDRARANRTNQNKREFFLIRLFKPKPKTGRR